MLCDCPICSPWAFEKKKKKSDMMLKHVSTHYVCLFLCGDVFAGVLLTTSPCRWANRPRRHSNFSVFSWVWMKFCLLLVVVFYKDECLFTIDECRLTVLSKSHMLWLCNVDFLKILLKCSGCLISSVFYQMFQKTCFYWIQVYFWLCIFDFILWLWSSYTVVGRKGGTKQK